MKIVKESGQKEDYNREKLCNSLRGAGVSEDMVENICKIVEKEMAPYMATSEIFRQATRHLMEHNTENALRYNLKKGMQNLGPAGFHFEHFIEAILQSLEFKTERNRIIEGQCVSHEVDVVAKKNNKIFIIEAKYHNKKGIKSHIDDVMYAEGRMEDIHRGSKNDKFNVWLITNTKFTKTAIKYASCREISITGWKYPKGKGLEHYITIHKLYPVTVLPAVGVFEREAFARKNVMLVQDLAPFSAQDLIMKFGIKEPSASEIIGQVQSLIYSK